MQAFGGPVLIEKPAAEEAYTSAAAAAHDMDRVRELLTALNDGGRGLLRIYRPHPTAAFAPRDTTLPQYGEAAKAMELRGYAPVERRAGGQLAVYDAGALVIDLVAPHAEPRQHVIERFRGFSAAIASALNRFSIDARVGEVAGEYCPGDYSVNAEGRIKLVGVAQRVGRRAYHLGAVISVQPSEAAKRAVAEAYRIYGFPFAPDTFGALHALDPGLGFAELREALAVELGRLLPIEAELNPCG
jgi:lipoate-protein ligase A